MSNLVPARFLYDLEDRIEELEYQNEQLSNETQELTVLNQLFFDKLIELGFNPNDLIPEDFGNEK